MKKRFEGQEEQLDAFFSEVNSDFDSTGYRRMLVYPLSRNFDSLQSLEDVGIHVQNGYKDDMDYLQ